MTYIATTAQPIPAEYTLREEMAREVGDYYLFELPNNFFRLDGGGIPLILSDGKLVLWHRYQMIGRNKLMLPKNLKGAKAAIYYRYPDLVDLKNPDENEELDVCQEGASAIPYYVAAQLLIYDDPFRYATYRNEFDDRVNAMRPALEANWAPIYDVYQGVFAPGEYV